jgi:hypothetical protein
MDRITQQQDIIRFLGFTEKLLEFLLKLVPPHWQPNYNSVWANKVKPKLAAVQDEVRNLAVTSEKWNELDDVGWDPESARLKTEVLKEKTEKGALATVIRLTNSALGSLKIVFLGLEPPKEFKDFLETWAEGRNEPESQITTLFGPGPIPGPPSPPSTPKVNKTKNHTILKLSTGRKFR